jgi:guanylate kinase
MVPWPEAEWRAMQNQAAAWRTKLQSLEAGSGSGTLFLLDGASCSGKSTLVDRLTADPDVLELVPRYSTRERRIDDQRRREYIFVSHEAFRERASAGAFIEYHDFQFGMSYGLPWAEAFAPLLRGRAALGVINLGNVEHVKALLPEAVTILVDASIETIRRRLIGRGVNTPEQIEERLSNAARVQQYRKFYDYVVTNEEGVLNEAEAFLRNLIASRTLHP